MALTAAHLNAVPNRLDRRTGGRLIRRVAVAVVLLGVILLWSCSKRESGKESEDKQEPFHETKSRARDQDDSGYDRPRENENVDGKSEAEELRPSAEEIGEDCVGFVRATKVVGAAPSGDCPQCPDGNSTEAFRFDSVRVDSISCHEQNCDVTVTILATIKSNSGGQNLAGGLTGWIPPEQKQQILSGRAGTQQQMFKVNVTYRREGEGWRAIEFNR